jgi:hypothetical protein
MRMTDKMLHVLVRAGKEVVDTDDMRAVLYEPLAQMRTEKAGSARHEYAFFEMHGNLSGKSPLNLKTTTRRFNLQNGKDSAAEKGRKMWVKIGAGLALCYAVALIPAAAEASVAISISPGYTQVVAEQTIQFSAAVSGSGDTGVVWQVNNADGGGAASGTVSSSGLYTPPPNLPDPALVTVTAQAHANRQISATASVTLLARAPSGTTYYVATNGNDSNKGSIRSPWQTIQHAADTAVAGDTVLVRAGVYNEHVGFHVSGNQADGSITFANYPGETATLDGTGLDIPNGQYGLFTLKDVSDVIVTGFELRNYKTGSLRQVPIGIFIVGAGSGVQIVNNRIHDIWTTAKTTPQQCGSDAFGLTVYGKKAPAAIEGLAISGNEIYRLKTGCSETLSLDGNVKNFAVVSNIVHDDDNIGIGAIGFERVSPDPRYDQARDGEIRGNIVYNITSYGNPDYGKQYASDGIYVDGGRNITIEQNLVHDDDLGIELASEHRDHVTSKVTARNNVIYSGNSAGISIGGYGAKRGGTEHCAIVNNSLWNNDTKNTGSGEIQIQFNATHNMFVNNIAYAGPESLLVNDFTVSTPDPAALDYNLYYAKSTKAKFTWQKARYAGLADYQNGSDEDANSLFADPQFLGLGKTPDLDISNNSPAIAAGDALDPGIVGNDDFLGDSRVTDGTIDIGAFEK